MFDADTISARVFMRHIRLKMTAHWLQNCFNTTQTPTAFEKESFIRYNLRIFTRIFERKLDRKTTIFGLAGKKILSLKSVMILTSA